MATSRLAEHLPSLFGPSRRAAWRLSVARRILAALALLLALHLAAGSRAPAPASPSPEGGCGPTLTVPVAAPVDHLGPGDPVGVYVPGESDPVADATVLTATSEAAPATAPVVEVCLAEEDVGHLVRRMGTDGQSGAGFVLVRAD